MTFIWAGFSKKKQKNLNTWDWLQQATKEDVRLKKKSAKIRSPPVDNPWLNGPYWLSQYQVTRQQKIYWKHVTLLGFECNATTIFQLAPHFW